MAREALEHQLAERDPAPDVLEQFWLGAPQPAQFGWPIAPVHNAADAGVYGAHVKALAKERDVCPTARIQPQINRGERCATCVDAQQAVPESVGCHREYFWRPEAAPYGGWRSPISATSIAAGAVSLAAPEIVDGDVYWLEGKPLEAGRVVLVRQTTDGSRTELTPRPLSVRTRVHEYGGGA